MARVKELYRNAQAWDGQSVELSGWIRTTRVSKSFGFIELNDGGFFKNAQIVFDDSLENFQEVSKYQIATALTVRGTLVYTPEAKQPFEVKAKEILLEGASSSDFPLQKKRHTFEYLRTIAHLRPRGNTYSAVFRVRSLAAFAIHKFFQERGFVYVHTPIITGSDAEGAGEMFRVTTLDPVNPPLTETGAVDYAEDFFGKESNLTVSGQLNAEAYALAFRDVYTFGPTFRAENSNTARHAAEFWMIEPEIAFADLQDDMKLAEDMLKYVIAYILEQAPEEMEFFNQFIDKTLLERLQFIVDSDFKQVTYTEAVELLQKSGKEFDYPVTWGADLQTEHERYLTEVIFQRPIFVTDYPKEIKAFYMRLNADEKTVRGMDVLVPRLGEIIGGSERESNLDVLTQRMLQLKLDPQAYWWYLDLRRFGSVPHAGFGLGFERAVQYITGMGNIRDVIPYPRAPKLADF